MPSGYHVFDSIDQVDLAAWEQVRTACGASIFMDPRFVGAVETSLRQDYRFWHVIVDDDDGNPAAIACLNATTIDVASVADARWAARIRRLPAMLQRLARFNVLFCGLPGSPGEKGLALVRTDAGLLARLDEAIGDVAARIGADVVVYKEFGDGDLLSVKALPELGYRRVVTQPMHFFPASFPDFAHYCAALSSRYRKHINRSTRKLTAAGVEISVLTGAERIVSAYTPEVHALYHQMVDRAEVNIELFPIEFFHQLSRRLESEVDLVVLAKDSRIIAMGWCLFDGSSYHMLYAGLDYRLNEELDLYFNLMYATLDRALRKGASRIHVGQTASAFKARLGCRSDPVYAFLKGRGWLMLPLVRFGSSLVLAEMPSVPPSDIFRKDVQE